MAKVIPLDKFAQELKQFSEQSIESYREAVAIALVDAIPRLVAKSPVDTGLYAQSWKMDINEKMAMIGNISPHAPIIEFGARPFYPPLKPLVEWAKRVLQKPEIDSDCYALAKAVQNKIASQGMEPRHILTNEMDAIIDDIKKNLEKALK